MQKTEKGIIHLVINTFRNDLLDLFEIYSPPEMHSSEYEINQRHFRNNRKYIEPEHDISYPIYSDTPRREEKILDSFVEEIYKKSYSIYKESFIQLTNSILYINGASNYESHVFILCDDSMTPQVLQYFKYLTEICLTNIKSNYLKMRFKGDYDLMYIINCKNYEEIKSLNDFLNHHYGGMDFLVCTLLKPE